MDLWDRFIFIYFSIWFLAVVLWELIVIIWATYSLVRYVITRLNKLRGRG